MQNMLFTVLLMFVFFTACITLTVPNCYAQKVAVIYPEVRDPYLQIFLTIIDGAKTVPNTDITPYPLKKQNSPENLKRWFEQNNINVAITLGNRGYAVIPDIPISFPVVTGAILINPDTNGVSGISLAPSPQNLFLFLRKLLPQISNIHTIYLPDQNGWLIKQAKVAAKNQQMTLQAQGAHNIHKLAELYKSLLDNIDPTKSALWLPYTGRGLERALMQKVLETAWERNIVVFSSNFSDVKRGVLFSLYPDNFEMGKSLAKMAIQRIGNNEQPHRITLVDTLLKAVNLRTADHLGLHFTKTQEKNFDFIYPPQ